MTNKKENYRAETIRKPHWDYSSDGYYFITIVTQNRVRNLGEIIDNKIVLSDFGKIIDHEWKKSFEFVFIIYISLRI